jgi:transcriptional regulator LmrA/YxaF-like protein
MPRGAGVSSASDAACGIRAERKRSTERRHSEARAERLAALVVAAVEGAIVLSRAERHPGRGSRSAAELEDVIASALP